MHRRSGTAIVCTINLYRSDERHYAQYFFGCLRRGRRVNEIADDRTRERKSS